MDSVIELFKDLGAEGAMIFCFVLFLCGFVAGILVWRWFKKAILGEDESLRSKESLNAEMIYLEQALIQLGTAVAELFTKVRLSPNIGGTMPGEIRRYASDDDSHRRKFFLFNWFRRVRKSTTTSGSSDVLRKLNSIKNQLNELARQLQYATSYVAFSPEYERSRDSLQPRSDRELSMRPEDPPRGIAYVDQKHAERRQVPIALDSLDQARAEPYSHDLSAAHASFEATSRGRSGVGIQQIVELYNRAVRDSLAREQFREYYQPIRIGTINAVERRQNPTISAQFKETTDGDFFALPMVGTDRYSIFPRLGLTIETVSYGAGAVGEVFSKTPNYDPKLFYSRYAVRSPASFRKLGERWDLIDSGELDLGQPD